MKRFDPPHLGRAGEFASCDCREVRSLGRKRGVLCGKDRFDEQHIGAANEASDGSTIRGGVVDIGHIADLLTGCYRKNVTQPAKWHFARGACRSGGNIYRVVVRLIVNDRTLELVQPWPCG